MSKPARVIIESPYAGDVRNNLEYLVECLRDSFDRDEAPFASHGLYPQDGVLNEEWPGDREIGLAAGFRWMECAEYVAVYDDLGVSPGMRAGVKRAGELEIPVVYRSIRKKEVKPVPGRGYIIKFNGGCPFYVACVADGRGEYSLYGARETGEYCNVSVTHSQVEIITELPCPQDFIDELSASTRLDKVGE